MSKKNYVNQDDWSLYNLTIRKMRRVRDYINNLIHLDTWENKTRERFYEFKEKILLMNNANDMLDAIGYNYNKKPKIYDTLS